MSGNLLLSISAVSWIVAAILAVRSRRRKNAAQLVAWGLLGFTPINGSVLPLPWDERWTYDVYAPLFCLDQGRLGTHVHVSKRWWDPTIGFVEGDDAEARTVRNPLYCREVRKSYYNRSQAKR